MFNPNLPANHQKIDDVPVEDEDYGEGFKYCIDPERCSVMATECKGSCQLNTREDVE
jgi:hypothetical protein